MMASELVRLVSNIIAARGDMPVVFDSELGWLNMETVKVGIVDRVMVDFGVPELAFKPPVEMVCVS